MLTVPPLLFVTVTVLLLLVPMSWPEKESDEGEKVRGDVAPVLTQVVNKIPTTTTVTSSLNPTALGQSVTFTATVTATVGAPPNGETVTFNDGLTTIGTGTLSAGAATFTTSALPAGTHSIKATYLADPHFATSTSAALTEGVNGLATTTAVGSSLNASIYGQSVTFTATVAPRSGSGVPTGTVTFKNGTSPLAKVALNSGTAAYTNSTRSITAVYSGDGTYAASTSAILSQVVNKATSTTTLTSSLNPSTSGQSVTLTVKVAPQFTGTPAGTVTLKLGTTPLTTLTLSGGTASFTTTTLPAGPNVINADYNGSPNFMGSSTTIVQTVNP